MKQWLSTFVLVFAAIVAGCSSGSSRPTPTLTSDQVIRTAEAIAQLTSQATTPTPSPIPASPTGTPTLATSTPAPTPSSASPMATAKYTVAVRTGPGEVYEQLDLFVQGQVADVYGQYTGSPIGPWYFIHRIGAGKDGWVWSGAVDFSGNPAQVPPMDAPPTPSGPSPTPTP
jgi:hypothetical protein